MTIIDLHELYQLYQSKQNNWFNLNADNNSFNRELQEQFHLIVQQKQLGLPIERLLKNNPLLAEWLNQLEQFIPGLFKPNKKLYLNTPITAQIKLKSNLNYQIQVPVNLAVIKQKIRLLEWGIRSPSLTWADQVKLWIACHYFQVNLSTNSRSIAIIVCAFSHHYTPEKKVYFWDKKQHNQTEKLLSNLFQRNHPETNPDIESQNFDLLDIESIEEVPL